MFDPFFSAQSRNLQFKADIGYGSVSVIALCVSYVILQRSSGLSGLSALEIFC